MRERKRDKREREWGLCEEIDKVLSERERGREGGGKKRKQALGKQTNLLKTTIENRLRIRHTSQGCL